MKFSAVWQKGKKRRKLYKFSLLTIFPLWTFLLFFHIHRATTIRWPKNTQEILLCSSDLMEDLFFFLGSFVKKTKHSLFVSTFGLDDPLFIDLFYEQAQLGKKVEVAFDANQTHMLSDIHGISLLPFQEKGRLMHRKVVALDEELLLFGSTNLTTSSLKLHRNQCVAIRSKELYEALKKEARLDHPKFSFYPLPKEGKAALYRLLQEISRAKKEIFVAMYTFTHKEILDALIAASKRGVSVYLYIDKGMAHSVCKKILPQLLASSIYVAESRGDGYLHYKCALIDDLYVFGSTNWTQAGFSKNLEYLIWINQLESKEFSYLKRFFNTLKMNCKELKKPAIE